MIANIFGGGFAEGFPQVESWRHLATLLSYFLGNELHFLAAYHLIRVTSDISNHDVILHTSCIPYIGVRGCIWELAANDFHVLFHLNLVRLEWSYYLTCRQRSLLLFPLQNQYALV